MKEKPKKLPLSPFSLSSKTHECALPDSCWRTSARERGLGGGAYHDADISNYLMSHSHVRTPSIMQSMNMAIVSPHSLLALAICLENVCLVLWKTLVMGNEFTGRRHAGR